MGGSNYRPSAPFLYEVASHVKNCHFWQLLLSLLSKTFQTLPTGIVHSDIALDVFRLCIIDDKNPSKHIQVDQTSYSHFIT